MNGTSCRRTLGGTSFMLGYASLRFLQKGLALPAEGAYGLVVSFCIGFARQLTGGRHIQLHYIGPFYKRTCRSINTENDAVPEPGSLEFLGAGSLPLLGLRRRK
jgi:hypothetical protein